MDTSSKPASKFPWLIVMAASLVAVLFLNSLAFGLGFRTLFDSLAHTFFIASLVSLFILSASPKIEDYSFSKRIWIIVIGIVPTTIAGVILAALFLRFINFKSGSGFPVPSSRTVIFSLIISYIFGLGGYLYISSRDRLKQAKAVIKEKEEAEQKAHALATEAKLASLESRIHPHFLFNTLNSIAALIRENPAQAEIMVERLSSVLRYSLENEADHLSTLERELKFTKDYLDIQKARFADRLEFKFEIEESVLSKQVPTFAVHTLVENTIKHVAGESTDRTSIAVRVSDTDDQIIICVEDNGPGFSGADIKAGHGLDNLRQRMGVLYGSTAELIIDGSAVRLNIPNK